jgi:hypothetical protein
VQGDAGHRVGRRDHPAFHAFLSVVALATLQAAPPPKVAQVGEITAVAQPALMSLALSLAEEADQPRSWPGLGRRSPGAIRLIVVRDRDELQHILGSRAPAWGAGFALPASHTILIRADAGDPSEILRHELAHLALRRAVHVTVPRWFDEGYAAYAAGEWGRMDALDVNLAVLTGRIPDLDALNGALRGRESEASLAYALAMTAVMDLARRHPTHSLEPLLAGLQQGEPFDSVLRRTTGLTYGQFAVAWERGVRRRYGVLGWFTLGGLWLVLALALVVAVWVRRRLDRPRRAALDVGWPEPPSDDAELDQPRQDE